MNRLFTIIILIITLILTLLACSRNPTPLTRMEQIKSVGDRDPVLAMRMLDSLQSECPTMSKYEQMKRDLLQERLRDKAYIPAPSDLKINPVVEYFEVEGADKERQEAHYYAGSVYRDLQETPRALEHFLQAEEICSKASDYDSTILLNTYSNLHWLYYNVQDYDNALAAAIKESELAEKMNQTDIVSMIHLGASYLRIGNEEQARNAYTKALEFYRTGGGMQSGEDLVSLLYSFSRLGMQDEAMECFNYLRAVDCGIEKTPDYYMALGKYHQLIAEEDLAIYNFQKALSDMDESEGRYGASKELFRIYMGRKDLSLANRMAEVFVNVSDTLNLGERQRLAATVNNAFTYHRNQRQEASIREERNHYRNIVICLSLVTVIVVLGCIIILISSRNKRLKELIGKTDELKRVEARSQELTAEIAVKQQQLDQAKTELQHKTEELKQIKLQLATALQSDMDEEAEDIINSMRSAADGPCNMKTADWHRFYQAMDKLNPTLREELNQKYGQLDQIQLQLCYLLEAGFTPSQIQNLIPRSRVTIWRWIKKFSGED